MIGLRVFGLLTSMGLLLAAMPGALFPMAATWLFSAVFVRKTKPDRLSSILPDPAPPGQFRTTVLYRRDRMTTGRDEVALTFVEGWLYGEGLHSNFALRVDDLLDLRTGSDRTGNLWLVDGSELKIMGLEPEPRVGLEKWYAARCNVHGIPTFPPARVHSQQISRWLAYLLAGPILGLLVAGMMVLTDGLSADHQNHGLLKLIVRFVLLTISLFGLRRLFRLMKIVGKVRQAEETAATFGRPIQRPDLSHELEVGRRLEENRTKVRIS